MSTHQPSLRAYTVIKREGQDDFWLAIGAAFAHEKGTPRPLPPGTWPKASDEGYFKNLISGGRKHSWECSRSPLQRRKRTFLRM